MYQVWRHSDVITMAELKIADFQWNIHSRFWPLWPRLTIASCGYSGNCTHWIERHWVRSHDSAQMAAASLDQNGTTHWRTCHFGNSWQLSLGPRVVVTWLFMVIYYFFTFYTKMRWLDGPRLVPGVIPAPLLLRWYNGDVQLVSFFFFFFVTFIKIIYFGVGHRGPGTVAHWLEHWIHDHKVVGTSHDSSSLCWVPGKDS